ncbi:MAG: DUF294 nucleotidyltransferase-like domain-containing protein [Desulfobacteraceae bacterium]|nr:DUF294 nucleotidyltransferase-like domain-containing protein [Desulfobacteraceae bacterium]
MDKRIKESQTISPGETDESSLFLADEFLWKPVGKIARVFPSCRVQNTIREAAGLLEASGRDAIIVINDEGSPSGLVTDSDLRQKVVIEGYCADEAVGKIMSSPLVYVNDSETVFEALLSMMKDGIKHLGVFYNNAVRRMITERDLLLEGIHSPVLLVHDIKNVRQISGLKEAYAKVPAMVGRLLSRGVLVGHVNEIITAVNDAVLARVMDMTLEQIGPPPADFAFLLFGSEGRKEQTLKTDQDNGIVYSDPEPEDESDVNRYFLEMGTLVCDQLHEIGQKYCDFNVMAKNPKWCQPMSRWEKYYRAWIVGLDPERILYASIFFDFRLGFGSQELVDELHEALFAKLEQWQALLGHMAQNTLYYRLPISFFGNFVLRKRGEGKGGLNIKGAMRLLVDFSRIYALQEKIKETNTAKRLLALYRRQRFKKKEYDNIMHAYNFLMYQRLRHQSRMIEQGGDSPDNFIKPGNLTAIDQQALKAAFKQIRIARVKLKKMDFFPYS